MGNKTQARSFDGYKGHVAMDPGTIITDTHVTPANASDGSVDDEIIADLLAEAASDQADRVGGEHAGPGAVYGDNAYGTGEFQRRLEDEGLDSRCKTQRPNATNGLFGKDRFGVNLEDDTVTCPARVTVSIRRHRDGAGIAKFADTCTSCAMRAQCTTAKEGRSIAVGPNEAVLARARQQDPAWITDYRVTRPKVERKIAHLMGRSQVVAEPGYAVG